MPDPLSDASPTARETPARCRGAPPRPPLKEDSSRDACAHLELGDFPVLNLVEQRHHPHEFSAQQKVSAGELVAGTLFGIELYIEQEDRAGIEDRLLILYQ